MSILRPVLIIGLAMGGAMDLVPPLGVYAAMLREQGRPLDFPGGAARVAQAVDVDLLARAIAWSGEAEAARNEAFNVTNGDVFTWENIWPAIADALEMKPGKHVPLSMAKEYPNWIAPWDALRRKHNLASPGLEGIRRPVVPIRRLQHALRPDRVRPALDRLHREDQPRRIYGDDGHRGHVAEVVRPGEGAAAVAVAMLAQASPPMIAAMPTA